MRKPGGSFVTCVAAVCAFCTAVAAPTAQGSSSVGATMMALLNGVRVDHGVRPLRRSRVLDRSAALKAADIERCGSFSHEPCGVPFTYTFQQVGYWHGTAAIGENLYYGTGSGLGSPSAVLDAWLHSPPHRANIFRRLWRQAGVAVVHADSLFGTTDVWLFVVQFGRPG